jgi:23S rRNA (pseudouridine1915-N3)-methyltransferase
MSIFRLLPFLISRIQKTYQRINKREKEAQYLLKNISNQDYIILLDERGKEYSSVEFSNFLEKQMISSVTHLVFMIGGPYGFDDSVYQRANAKISLSRMTFSHQMVRLFFVEQIYRAYTIMRGEPYHHE